MIITGKYIEAPHIVWWRKFEGVTVIAYSDGSWISIPL